MLFYYLFFFLYSKLDKNAFEIDIKIYTIHRESTVNEKNGLQSLKFLSV